MAYDPTQPWPQNTPGTDPAMLSASSELIRALNRLERTMAAIFPLSGATATAAGAADGFLLVTLPDGTTRKVPLFQV